MTLPLKLTPGQHLLCQSIADENPIIRQAAANNLRAMIGDDATYTLVNSNELLPTFVHLLSDNEVELNSIPHRWQQAHAKTLTRISAYLTELDRIAARLAWAGIPLVALKNGGIARGIYPCPGCCPMGDLDVLVEKRYFRQAHHILLAEDYHFEFRSLLEEAELQAAEENGGAEYWKLLPHGEKMWFELQWRPVAGRWIRPDQEPSTEELLARSISIPGTVVRLLAPEDNLLQVALHTAKHSYVRAPGFRLHLDVERIVRAYPTLDWDLFVQQVKILQVKTPVYFSLAIPRVLFDTPIPDDVLAQLQPAAWKEWVITRWLDWVGLFNPDEQKFSKPGYILFTALLYDDLAGLWRGIFPDRDWMQKHYNFGSGRLLPLFHLRRLTDLVFRRGNI